MKKLPETRSESSRCNWLERLQFIELLAWCMFGGVLMGTVVIALMVLIIALVSGLF